MSIYSVHLYPIFAIGLIVALIIVERFVALYFSLTLDSTEKFMRAIAEHVRSGRIDAAIALCKKNRNRPVAKVVGAGLKRAHQGEAFVRHAMELALNESHQEIFRRTPFLGTLANISTLVGLCGTVLGLIQSFGAVGNLSAQQRGAAMAAGISTAMSSTLLGLSIAIVAISAYSLLMARVNKLNAELEYAAVETLDLVLESYLEARDEDRLSLA